MLLIVLYQNKGVKLCKLLRGVACYAGVLKAKPGAEVRSRRRGDAIRSRIREAGTRSSFLLVRLYLKPGYPFGLAGIVPVRLPAVVKGGRYGLQLTAGYLVGTEAGGGHCLLVHRLDA